MKNKRDYVFHSAVFLKSNKTSSIKQCKETLQFSFAFRILIIFSLIISFHTAAEYSHTQYQGVIGSTSSNTNNWWWIIFALLKNLAHKQAINKMKVKINSFSRSDSL